VKHIYLAPHLDDAVLSCGGAIHRRTTAGNTVVIITIFAGEPDSHLSDLALEQHTYWGDPPRPMALRRAEDAAALTLLNAQARHMDYLDAVFRKDADGNWLYADANALFGDVHAADPMALDGGKALADRLDGLILLEEPSAVYAPLGAGHHVDHQIVHAVARDLLTRGHRLAFYEDYPYSEQPGRWEAAIAAAGAEEWSVEAISLDAADLTAKVSAVSYYRTQLNILFGGAEAMPSRIWSFAATRSKGSLAERLWWPK
jgi:LmbE family N-acetylglucosaminyl deacetylase